MRTLATQGATAAVLDPERRPWWTIYATVLREHQLVLRKTENARCAQFCADVIDRLGAASIVYVAADQVDAIPTLSKAAGVFDYATEAEALREVRPPFPVTFLAVGGMWTDLDQDWEETSLYAALILDRLGSDRPAVLPFFRTTRSDLQPSTIGKGAATLFPGKGVHVWTWLDDMSERMEEEVKAEIGGGGARALRALFLLQSANVDAVPVPSARRGHVASGRPSYEVVIRQTRRPAVTRHGSRDWSHRWEVRGHFKHFHSGVIFDQHPDRRVCDAEGEECVRIWCPPHVKGPEEKPLIPKIRRVT